MSKKIYKIIILSSSFILLLFFYNNILYLLIHKYVFPFRYEVDLESIVRSYILSGFFSIILSYISIFMLNKIIKWKKYVIFLKC